MKETFLSDDDDQVDQDLVGDILHEISQPVLPIFKKEIVIKLLIKLLLKSEFLKI